MHFVTNIQGNVFTSAWKSSKRLFPTRYNMQYKLPCSLHILLKVLGTIPFIPWNTCHTVLYLLIRQRKHLSKMMMTPATSSILSYCRIHTALCWWCDYANVLIAFSDDNLWACLKDALEACVYTKALDITYNEIIKEERHDDLLRIDDETHYHV